MGKTDARTKPVQGTRGEDTRDLVVYVMMLVIGWSSMSCSSASIHETCAQAESWEKFGSYEECMALRADPTRARAPAEQGPPKAEYRERGSIGR